MTASFRARALAGVAASLTVTALFAASINVPAQAAPQPIPVPPAVKITLPGGAAASRVIPGRYLVETVAAPVAAGGNRFTTRASTTAATSAVKAAGGRVGASYSELWSGVSVTATDAQIRTIAQSPTVKAIYPVLKVSLPKTTRSATKVSSALDQVSALGLGVDGTNVKVGVIDTGIDYDNADLGGTGTDATPGTGAHPWAPTARVPLGWDFVGDDYDPDSDVGANWSPSPDADPDDCAGHGTHVAGIIGASGSGADDTATTGVAPNVVFGAYRIFGCQGSTDTAVIIAALTQARADGMNVVNLSLGSDFDSWPAYPENVAVANLAKTGTTVVVAAGNSGDTGLFSVGSPAAGAGVISVAAYEPATIRTRAISVNGVSYPYSPVDSTGTAPTSGPLNLKLATPAAAITACTADGALASATGSTLLIKRGGCAYHEKVTNAQAAGADAVVIYNTTAELGSFTAHSDDQGAKDPTIPAISISGTDGANIAAALGAGTPTTAWLDYQKDLPNPGAGQLASFSSAGLAADLSLVPTITAPGANIYSTLPLEQGGHGNMSGTSMASPYVAGAAALVIQARGLAGRSAAVAQLLYNTAVPVPKAAEAGATTHPEAVFRQGSGLVNIAGAIGAGVIASPSTIKLGEGKSHTLKISLTNHTPGVLTYTASRVSGVSAAASTAGGNDVGTTTPLYGFGEVGFKAYSKAVTIKPGKTARIKVKLTAPRSVLAGRAGLLYGGWVQFTTTGAGNTVSVPFAGLRGDYQAVRLLNGFRYVDKSGMPWALPTLGFLGAQGLGPDYYGQHTYTMDPDAYDVAFVLFHLDYPASDARLKVTNTRTHKSYDAVINWDTYNPDTGKAAKSSTHLGKLPRDASLQYVAMEDGYLSRGKVWRLPNGTYTMTLKVLKPLGKASKKKQWESFTTHSFVINFAG